MIAETLNRVSRLIAIALVVIVFLRIVTLVLAPLVQNQWWDLVFGFSLAILCILVASWQLFKQVKSQSTSLKFLFAILAFLVVLLTIVAVSLRRALS